MTDIDGIQPAFDAVRGEIASSGTCPPAGDIIRRGRVRRRARVAAAGAMAALAVGTVVTAVSRPDPQVVTPTSRPKPLHMTDLIYDPAARADPGHWTRGRFPTPSTGRFARPNTPVCGVKDTDPWPENDTTKRASGYELTYAPGITRADADELRGEQVMTFPDATTAHQMIALILTNALACRNTATITRPAIGDEALSLSHSYYPQAAATQTTEEAVAVRAGRAIAVYWDVHPTAASPQTTLTQHQRDARTMAGRLCRLDDGC